MATASMFVPCACGSEMYAEVQTDIGGYVHILSQRAAEFKKQHRSEGCRIIGPECEEYLARWLNSSGRREERS